MQQPNILHVYCCQSVYKNALWTALRTILRPKFTRLQSQNYSGCDTPDPCKRPRCSDSDTNFRLARQRSHRSCFTKRPLLFRF